MEQGMNGFGMNHAAGNEWFEMNQAAGNEWFWNESWSRE